MFIGLLPPGVLEVLLFTALVAGFVFVVRTVRRRSRFAGVKAVADLPTLATDVRVQATVRRIFRDPKQNTWVVEAAIGQRKFTFLPTDFSPETYQSLLNKKADFALYGLSTLAPGGADAMRDLIRDYDKANLTEESVRLVPAPPGSFANDYAVIGRVTAPPRQASLDGEPVTVYRTQVVQQGDLTLVLDLAAEEGGPTFTDGAMVHGSARLFGSLAA